MSSQGPTPAPHSAAVLTELRDDWWSSDYLRLVVDRLDLQNYPKIADLGCGHGHWGQALLPLLSENATIEGIDREPKWVDKATRRANQLALGARCRYQQASIEHLPFADGEFDLVTCQTLLMHVAEPRAALAEMLRVLRPGGRLLVAEPNNLTQQFSADSVNRQLSPSQLGELMSLFVSCSRGRAALGRGDDCIGDALPALLSEFDVEGVSVFQNERSNFILPPYSEYQRAELEQVISHADSGFWLWDKEDARELYAHGGAETELFETRYAVFMRQTQLFREQVRESQYTSNNGSLHYLISATRRS